MKTLIIYHAYENGPCPDGHWAAWVAKKKYPDADLCPGIYDRVLTINPYDYDRIVIVDFSFKGSVIESWVNNGIKVILIDHHKTAMNDLSGLMNQVMSGLNIKFDMAESGATLAWKTFFPDKHMPAVLRYVKDRDIWEHLLPRTHEVHAAMSNLQKDFKVYDVLASLDQLDLVNCLTPLGEKLLSHRRELVKKIAERAEFKTIANYEDIPTVVLADDEVYLSSDICQYLYLQYPEALFSCCVNIDSTGNKKYSLRSNKDGNNTDVGAIAKANGGGGHLNASGYTIWPTTTKNYSSAICCM